MTVTIHHGDCLDVLRTLADNSVDSICTDPPYGLRFMNAHWDYDIPSVEVWAECLRVLKPGGFLLAFAGTRTQHRMACSIEDAGFVIKDMLAWLYGQGMPKSGNLKPAVEPITMAQKSLAGTRKENVVEFGTGALNIDACRVQASAEDRAQVDGRVRVRENSERTAYGEFERDERNETIALHEAGRYPANLIHDGSDAVTALFPSNNPGCKPHRVKASDECVENTQAKGWGFGGTNKVVGYDDGDNLSAARFFYVAKATKKDRGEGNTHMTVKPTELMRYLVRLVTPTGGIVLDPFAGSGSTGKAANLEGLDCILIEREAEYVEIAKRRTGNG